MSKEMSKSSTWYECYIEGETGSSEACSDRMAYKQNEEVVYTMLITVGVYRQQGVC